MPSLKQTGKLRIEFEVPRDIQSFSPFYKKVHTTDIKSDTYSKRDPRLSLSTTEDLSKNVDQDALTKAFGLKPFYVIDTSGANNPAQTRIRSGRWLTLTDMTVKANQWEQNHKGSHTVKDVGGNDLSTPGIPSLTSIYRADQIGIAASAMADAMKIAAAESIPKTQIGSSFVWVQQSKTTFPENVGWIVYFKNFGSNEDTIEDFWGLKFGQYAIKLSSKGNARLYKYGGTSTPLDPVLIDQWEFANAHGFIGAEAYLVIKPIAGTLCFYFSGRPTDLQIGGGYFTHNAKGGHSSRVYSRNDTAKNDSITVEGGYILVGNNVSHRQACAISPIIYFDDTDTSYIEGTYISPIEKLLEAPPVGNIPFTLDKLNGLVEDYIPQKALGKTNITYSLKDGDTIDTSVNPPTAPNWISDGNKMQPRVFALMRTNDKYKTPYLFSYGIQFPGSYITDGRKQFTAPCGHQFSLQLGEDQDNDSFEVTYHLQRTDRGAVQLDEEGNPILDSDNNPVLTDLARVWQLCDKSATNVRVWWDEYTDETFTVLKESKFLFEGVSDEDGIEWEWIGTNTRRITFKFLSMWAHFRRKHLGQPALMAGKPCIDVIKTVVESAGFNIEKHFQSTVYEAFDLRAIKLPESETEGHRRFTAKAGMPTNDLLKYVLSFITGQDVLTWLRWEHLGFDAITQRPLFKWVLSIKPGSQSAGFPDVPTKRCIALLTPDQFPLVESDPSLLWYWKYKKKTVPPEANEIVFTCTAHVNIEDQEKITTVQRNYDSILNPASKSYLGAVITYPYSDTNIAKTRETAEVRTAYLLSQVGYARDESDSAEVQWKYSLSIMDRLNFYDRDNLTVDFTGYVKEIKLTNDNLKVMKSVCKVDSRFEWGRGKLMRNTLKKFTRHTMGMKAMPFDWNSADIINRNDLNELPEQPKPPVSSGFAPAQIAPPAGETTGSNAFMIGYSRVNTFSQVLALSDTPSEETIPHTPLSYADLSA